LRQKNRTSHLQSEGGIREFSANKNGEDNAKESSHHATLNNCSSANWLSWIPRQTTKWHSYIATSSHLEKHVIVNTSGISVIDSNSADTLVLDQREACFAGRR
jgi:hypothetical protein